MASTARAGAGPQQQRRPLQRIVPAIPHALNRRPAPKKPIPSEASGTARRDGESQQATNGGTEHSVDGTPTPQSGAPSRMTNGDMETGTDGSSTRAAESPREEAAPVHAEAVNDSLPAGPQPQSPGEPIGTSVDGEQAATTHVPSPEQPLVQEDPPQEAPVTILPSHHPRPSLDSIVFGNSQESPAMPSTPRETEPESHMLPQPVPRNPAVFGAPHFAPFHPGHSHHPSDTLPNWAAAPAVGLQDGSQGQASELQNPQVFTGVPRQDGYNGPYSPRYPAAATNGAIRSHSQSPLKSPASDMKGSSVHGEPPYQNGAGTRGLQSAASSFEPPAHFREPFELAGYLGALVGTPEFADFVLQVRANDSILLNVPVHGIVVARSPRILSAIRNLGPSAPHLKGSPPIVDIQTRDGFVSLESLKAALALLYGAPMVTVDSLLYRLDPFHPELGQGAVFSDAPNRMSQAISYTAAGTLFQLSMMLERGIECIKALLRWDTVDLAISYALSSGPYSPKDRLFSTKPSDQAEYQADQLLKYEIIDFIAFNFPVGFRLDTSAPELAQTPRLPILPRQPSHNPRLSQIRFGDIPPQDESKPDYVTRTLSSLLLSLPLPLLDRLFNHRVVVERLGWHSLGGIMQDVHVERERRREDTLNKYNMMHHEIQGTFFSKALLENLLWQEHVRPSPAHPSGYTWLESRIANPY